MFTFYISRITKYRLSNTLTFAMLLSKGEVLAKGRSLFRFRPVNGSFSADDSDEILDVVVPAGSVALQLQISPGGVGVHESTGCSDGWLVFLDRSCMYLSGRCNSGLWRNPVITPV